MAALDSSRCYYPRVALGLEAGTRVSDDYPSSRHDRDKENKGVATSNAESKSTTLVSSGQNGP
eukprot:12926610-Prorocentrum_lima.AAC.1